MQAADRSQISKVAFGDSAWVACCIAGVGDMYILPEHSDRAPPASVDSPILLTRSHEQTERHVK